MDPWHLPTSSFTDPILLLHLTTLLLPLTLSPMCTYRITQIWLVSWFSISYLKDHATHIHSFRLIETKHTLKPRHSWSTNYAFAAWESAATDSTQAELIKWLLESLQFVLTRHANTYNTIGVTAGVLCRYSWCKWAMVPSRLAQDRYASPCGQGQEPGLSNDPCAFRLEWFKNLPSAWCMKTSLAGLRVLEFPWKSTHFPIGHVASLMSTRSNSEEYCVTLLLARTVSSWRTWLGNILITSGSAYFIMPEQTPEALQGEPG